MELWGPIKTRELVRQVIFFESKGFHLGNMVSADFFRVHCFRSASVTTCSACPQTKLFANDLQVITLTDHNSPYMQYYFKRFFVLHSLEAMFSFLTKRSRQKAIEIEIAFSHPLWNPKGRTLDHFFYASHIFHNFTYELIPMSMS